MAQPVKSISVPNASSEKCEVPGCIMHKVISFNSITPNSNGAKESFQARVHFKSYKELLDHAAESVKRIVQQKYARGGKFPQGRIVDVDHNAEFTRTSEDTLKELATMSKEELAAKFAEMQEMMILMEQLQK